MNTIWLPITIKARLQSRAMLGNWTTEYLCSSLSCGWVGVGGGWREPGVGKRRPFSPRLDLRDFTMQRDMVVGQEVGFRVSG